MAAENLLLGTCAQESSMGKYLVQRGKGPALGIFQMESATYDDLFENFLIYNKKFGQMVTQLAHQEGLLKRSEAERMVYDLRYAALMCRVHYLRFKEDLPNAYDIPALARYWKIYYNTIQGKGEEEEFIANYNRYVV